MDNASRAIGGKGYTVSIANGRLGVTIRHDSFRGYGVTGLDSTNWHLSPTLARELIAAMLELLPPVGQPDPFLPTLDAARCDDEFESYTQQPLGADCLSSPDDPGGTVDLDDLRRAT